MAEALVVYARRGNLVHGGAVGAPGIRVRRLEGLHLEIGQVVSNLLQVLRNAAKDGHLEPVRSVRRKGPKGQEGWRRPLGSSSSRVETKDGRRKKREHNSSRWRVLPLRRLCLTWCAARLLRQEKPSLDSLPVLAALQYLIESVLALLLPEEANLRPHFVAMQSSSLARDPAEARRWERPPRSRRRRSAARVRKPR